MNRTSSTKDEAVALATSENTKPEDESTRVSDETVQKRKSVAQEQMRDILTKDHIVFEPNTTNVVEESQPTLDKIAQVLRENLDLRVHIEGHVSLPIQKIVNPKKMRQAERLSADRAESIANEIVSRGIEADRLTPIGYGGTRPLPESQNSERVEIK